MTLKQSGWDICQAVMQELKWDTQLRDTWVDVEVNNGIVTLEGTVESHAKKLAAQEAAHRVKGVLDVINNIHIALPTNRTRADNEVAEAVRRALEWDELFPHDDVQTNVTNGWVTLEGSVPYYAERDQATKLIRNLTGVRGITNNLVVVTAHTAPENIRQSIEEALQRRATREAYNISITLKDGIVHLQGKVHNWNEKQAVLDAASHAPGVQKVEDHLEINPIF